MDETMQGIDARTRRAIEKMPCPENGDHYSATCRPGSWEWQTEEAVRMRYELERRGYRMVEDPEASWRVRWARESRRRGP